MASVLDRLIEPPRAGEVAYAKCGFCSFRKSAGSMSWATRYWNQHQKETGHDFGVIMQRSVPPVSAPANDAVMRRGRKD